MTVANAQKFPMIVVVIVDGNRHSKEHLKIIGAPESTPFIPAPVLTKLECPPTLKMCQKIVAGIKDACGVQARELTMHLVDQEWQRTFEGFDLDGNPNKRTYAEFKAGNDNYKTVEYDAAKNCLTIWQGGLPIYENNNGQITNDMDALADSIL